MRSSYQMLWRSVVWMSVLLLGRGMPNQAVAMDAAFTYQGQLQHSGTPVTGTCDLKFELYDAASDGTQIGSTVTKTGLTIANGLVTTTLDFGAAAFDGQNRWLEVSVKCGAEPSYTILAPRQGLTPGPYALHAGQVAWDNVTSMPAGFADGTDNDSGGDITSVIAGTGLTGGNTTGEATLSVDPAYVQRRLSSSCTPGSSIRAIAEDGDVICEVDDNIVVEERSAPPEATTLTALDGCFDGGTSVTIGADGLGLISYRGSNNGLKVAHCNDTACTSATLSTIDSDNPLQTSVTIGADGLGLISYYANTNVVKVAHCNDTACTNATLTTLDSVGNAGVYTSVTIGGDGLGLISYWHAANDALKVAHCNNTACTNATLSTIDSSGVGNESSVTIGTDGLGLISYHDATNDALKVAHCNNTVCTSATLSTIDNSLYTGRYTSVTIGTDGRGLISYSAGSWILKVAHCNDLACTIVTLTTIVGLSSSYAKTSVTVGADGLGLISYDILKVAHCNDLACTSATLATIDSTGPYSQSSVTIGADGLGLISYYNGGLKVAHCSNVFCVPYFRRR